MSVVTAQHLERYDGSGALWTRLAMRYPAIEDRLRDALFRPCYRFEFAVAQVGVHLERLEEALGPLSLDFLPDLPPRAVPPRRLSYLAGRLCAERALEQWGATSDWLIGRGSAGEPSWPRGWTGSIAHTNQRAIAVVTRQIGQYDIGIDAEPILDEGARRAVLQTCVHESELGYVSQPHDDGVAATALFAAKEAYYKSVYRAVRRFVDFKEVSLRHLDTHSGRFVLGPVPNLERHAGLPVLAGRFVLEGGVVHAGVAPGEYSNHWSR